VILQIGVAVRRHRLVQVRVRRAQALVGLPLIGNSVAQRLGANGEFGEWLIGPVRYRVGNRKAACIDDSVGPEPARAAVLVLTDDARIGGIAMADPVAVAINMLGIGYGRKQDAWRC